ncbi:MAG: hypothetical protein RRC07_16725 [Anaerolineae bacterium]|nr:hypothetical protein [Anaerolineae bacterium]
MLEILRNLTRTAEEKRQEALNAYLDGELRGTARERFEAELAADPSLRAEVAQLRAIKEQVGRLPRARAPRNYTLDPAVYGSPASAPGLTLYPALRLATVLTAFFFMLAVGLEFFTGQRPAMKTATDSVAVVETVEEEAVEEVREVSGERIEAPQEAAVEEEGEAARTFNDEDAAADAAEVELFGSASLTPTETLTEEPAALALPVPEAAEVEEAAEAALAEEEAAGEEPALQATGTLEEPAIAEVATAPLPPAPTTEPEREASRGGIGMSPLRIAQIVLGLALIISLGATLLFRRQRV